MGVLCLEKKGGIDIGTASSVTELLCSPLNPSCLVVLTIVGIHAIVVLWMNVP